MENIRMIRNLKYLIILLPLIGFLSCGTTEKNVYSFSGMHFKSDSTIVLKKSNKISSLKIINYTYPEFPNNVINSLPKIEKLIVYSNSWHKRLYKDNSEMNIEEIEIDSLSFNGISLDSLIALKSLSLWGFTFKSFPMELSRLKELEELDLVLCSFTDFPQDLSAFNNLKRLDLSSNDISTIPKSVVFPKSLEVLILSNNALTDFPSASIPERLNKIDLTKNSFTFDKKVELLLDLLKNNQIDKIYVSTTSCEEKKKLNRITEDKNLKKKIKIFVSGKPICI